MNRRRKRELDLERELRDHLDLEAEEQQAKGLPPEAARYGARRALGNTALIQEDVRQAWGWTWLERLGQDVRHVVRGIRRSPGFAIVAVLSLAIGIGASTSVFTVFHAMFLRSLPVRDPQQLRFLNWTGGENVPAMNISGYGSSVNGIRTSGSFSWDAFQAIKKGQTGFSSVAGYSQVGTNVITKTQAWQTPARLVSANFFDVLGTQPAVGRAFTAEDDSLAAQPTVLLSWRMAQRLFGSDRSAVGSSVTIQQVSYTVIGVLPPDFVGLRHTSPDDVYLPLARAHELNNFYRFDRPDTWWIEAIGRVAPGKPDREVRAALDVILAQVAGAYGAQVKKPVDAPKSVLLDGRTGLDILNTDMSRNLRVLFAMVGLMLLVACANVANLLLARGGARARELAIRLSLGAGRMRIVRHLFTESLVLALAGGLLGLLLARLGTVLLTGLLMQADDTSIDLKPDATVMAFAMELSLVTALLFGVLPAWRSTGVHPAACLRQGGAGAGSLRQRLAKSLVVVQIALAFVLVFGAGLFVRTLANLGNVSLGFRPDRLLLFSVDPSRSGYKEQRLVDVYRRIHDGVAAIPGVRAATFSSLPPLGGMSTDNITVPGYTPKPGERISDQYSQYIVAGEHFLTIMGTPILLGRDLSASDDEGSAKVAVINQTLAKQYFTGNPVGREFVFGSKSTKPIRIVGVSADAKTFTIRSKIDPTVYLSYAQYPGRLGGVTFEVRAAGDALALSNAVRRAVAAVDPTLPVAQIRTQSEQIHRNLFRERTFAFLSTFFSAITLALACIGIYGVFAYAVARRTSEFGVRMAVGASGAQVGWLVLRGALLLVALGMAIGVPAALAVATLIRAGLFGVEPADPATIAAAGIAMVVAAGVAAWMPARRAALLDPVVALRYE
jgi:predicted permease